MRSPSARTATTTPLALISAGALVVAGLSGCSALSDSGEDGTLSVAASFYPLEFVAQRVGGDLVDVSVLTAPGQEPHDLELSVAQTVEVAEADLVLLEGALQPVVADAVEQNGTGVALDVEDVVDLRASSDEHDHGEGGESGNEDGEDHDHGAEDPHFWLDPLLVAQYADAVADELADLDPAHAADYRAGAEDLVADLEDLDARWTAGLADCERDVVVVSHDAFGYLDRYGLDLHGIAGLSPDSEPTPAVLGELQELIRTEGVTTVFTETLAPPALADTLAEDAGVTTAVLDPIEGLTPEAVDDGQDYLALMDQNLAALREANGCR